MNNDKSPSWDFFRDKDSEEGDASEKPVAKPDFFRGYLSDRGLLNEQRKKSENSEDEDDDDTPEAISRKKKKGFAKQLDKVFPKLVSPDQKDIKPPVAETLEPVDLTAPEAPIVHKQEADSVQDESSATKTEQNNEPIEEIPEKPVLSDEEEGVLQINHTEKTLNEPVFAETEFSQATDVENPKPIEVPKVETVPQAIVDEGFATSHGEKRSDSNTETRTETIIERKEPTGALLAFLGAEFLSRRRDRKLGREIRSNKKEVQEKIRKIQENQISQTEARDNLKKHQQEQIKPKLNGTELGIRPMKIQPNTAPVQKAEKRTPEEYLRRDVQDLGRQGRHISEQVASYRSRQESYAKNQETSNIRYESTPEKQRGNIAEKKTERQAESIPDILAARQETLMKNRSRQRSRSLSKGKSYTSLSAVDSLSTSVLQSILPVSNNDSVKPKITADPVYKTSIKFGISAGLILTVLGLIIYSIR